jgi:hypothetical protein
MSNDGMSLYGQQPQHQRRPSFGQSFDVFPSAVGSANAGAIGSSLGLNFPASGLLLGDGRSTRNTSSSNSLSLNQQQLQYYPPAATTNYPDFLYDLSLDNTPTSDPRYRK